MQSGLFCVMKHHVRRMYIPPTPDKDYGCKICFDWRNFIYESNRHRAPHRRPGPRGHPQGDPPHHAYPRGRPVVDDIGTVGEILLRDGRFGQEARVEVVHSDENAGPDRGDTGGVELKA